MTVTARPIMIRASTAVLSSRNTSSLLLEVLRVPTGRRATLSGVLRAEALRSVGAIGRRRHLEEADLADLHARIERDRQIRDVRQLQGDVSVPAGVDESGGRMDDEAQSSERTLSVQSSDDVIGDRDALGRRAQHELARVQDHRRLRTDVNQLDRKSTRLNSSHLGISYAVFCL